MRKEYLIIIITVIVAIICCIYYATSASRKTVELRNKIDESLNSYGIPVIGNPEIKIVRLPKKLNEDMEWSLINGVCQKEDYDLEKYKGKKLFKWKFNSVDLCDSCSKSKVYILLYGDEIACVYKTIEDAAPNLTWASRVLECNKELTDNKRKNFCYYERRHADEGKLLCEIFIGKYKWRCYSDFKKGDEIFCEKLDKFEDKQKCLWYIAIKTGNINLCEKIEDESRRSGCYKGVAETTANTNVCGKITDGDSKDYCYHSIAKNTLNISLCDKIRNNITEGRRNLCFQAVASSIASNFMDSSKCEEIEYKLGRDYCFSTLASVKNDINACTKIEDYDMLNRCVIYFGIINNQDVSNYLKIPINVDCDTYAKEDWKLKCRDIIKKR